MKYKYETTTINIKKSTKDKLKILKDKQGGKYDDVINRLLNQKGGEIVDDIITINRDSTALSLKYFETKNSDATVYDISFQELKLNPVGTIYIAEDNPAEDNYVNCTAEIVYKKNDDVILLVKEYSKRNGKYSSISSTVHINLF